MIERADLLAMISALRSDIRALQVERGALTVFDPTSEAYRLSDVLLSLRRQVARG